MWMLKFILTFSLFIEIFACHEEKFEITTNVRHPYWKYYPHRGNVWVTKENVTYNSTIICENVDSIQHIVYAYREQNYEQSLEVVNSTISTIQPMELTRFSTIISLVLSNLQLTTVLPGAFNGLTRLKKLYLNDNRLTEICNGVLNSLHRLELLNLSNNQINKIDKYCLMGLANLRSVLLVQNKILTIENGVFNTLSHLQHIDISENPLDTFPFEDLSNIETLIVTKTKIAKIDEDISNLTMKVLNISQNHIGQIDFSNLPTVNMIDISYNEIDTIENCQSLDGVDVKIDYNNVVTIDGLFNRISHLSISHNQLQILEAMFNDTTTITHLDFSYNRISTIEKEFFQDMKNLKSLYLQHNNVSKIDPILFRDLASLTVLDLSQNQIKEFQYGTFDNLISLEVINISSNKLLDLHQYTFNSLSRLKILNFDNNKISSFDVTDLKDHVPNLQVISLNHNAWNCKELVRIQQLCKKFRIIILPGYSYEVENLHGIACFNTNEVNATNSVLPVSVQEMAQSIQKGINSAFQNSKMNKFFNEEFENSKLVKYFDADYSQSKFFKFLSNYKFTMITKQLNDTKMEKFTEMQVMPSENNNKIIIFGVVLLFIAVFLLLSMFCLSLNYLYRFKSRHLSQMELC